MALELISARDTFPYVLVLDLVAVLCGDFHALLRERSRNFRAPGFKLRAVGIVPDLADHEGGEVAVFVCKDVVEAFFVVDDFLGELDATVMPICSIYIGGEGTHTQTDSFTPPIRTTRGRLEGLGPYELYAACRFGEFGYAAVGDSVVDFSEEGFCDSVFASGEVFALGAELRHGWR